MESVSAASSQTALTEPENHDIAELRERITSRF